MANYGCFTSGFACLSREPREAWLQDIIKSGGVGERLKPAVLKTVGLERASGVRIPPPPPEKFLPPLRINPFASRKNAISEFSYQHRSAQDARVLYSLDSLQASEAPGASITAAKTRRSNGKREAGDESSTLYKVGEMQNHPSGRWLD